MDRYIVAANQCQRMASKAPSETEKASWFRMAESWLRLASWKSRREADSNGEVTAARVTVDRPEQEKLYRSLGLKTEV